MQRCEHQTTQYPESPSQLCFNVFFSVKTIVLALRIIEPSYRGAWIGSSISIPAWGNYVLEIDINSEIKTYVVGGFNPFERY